MHCERMIDADESIGDEAVKTRAYFEFPHREASISILMCSTEVAGVPINVEGKK